MSKTYDEMVKQYFRENVKFVTNEVDEQIATWESIYHPEYPVTVKTIHWTAECKPSGDMRCGYQIGKGDITWVTHKQIDPTQFKKEIFELWKKQ